jgi:hypothetical protein
VKKELARFKRVVEHDDQFKRDFQAIPESNKEKREALMVAWGRELRQYQTGFNRFREKIFNGERYTATASFNALATQVDTFYYERQSNLNQFYVLEQEQKKSREEKRAEKKQKRLEAKGGTYKALDSWEKTMTEQKSILAKMEGAESSEREKLSKKRKSLLEKAIEDLLKVYNKATPEGQQYLSKAHTQAMALQHDLIDQTSGPTPPPLPLPENPGRQPMDGAVWHNGYWKLENNKWVWKPGFWELPPGAVMPQ